MRKRTKLIVGGLTVALALAAVVNAASARRFEVSEQRFLVLFRELTWEDGGGTRVICDINLEGSFHSRTISKVSGQLIGYITEAVFHRPCRENDSTVLTATLPWHIAYLRFEGALPNITGIEIQLNNGGWLVSWFGVSCLYEATAAAGFRGILNIGREAGGRLQVITFRINETAPIRKKEGGILCPAQLTIAGEGRVGTQTEWRLIFVRLVA